MMIVVPSWVTEAREKLDAFVDDLIRDYKIDWALSHDSIAIDNAKETIVNKLWALQEKQEDSISTLPAPKIKTFTEEEIFEAIDGFEFTNIIRMNSNLGANTTQDKIKEELKSKFRTPQGFRRAIERDGLVGTDFSENTKNEVHSQELLGSSNVKSLGQSREATSNVMPSSDIHFQNKKLLDKDYGVKK